MSLRWLAFCCLLMVGCAGTSARRGAFQPNQNQARLTELIVQRLEVGRQVAWIKYVNHIPVKDPEREALVLNSLTEQGIRMGGDPAVTKEFFCSQILASRMLQEQLIRKWKRGSELPAYPPQDLKRNIRPKLDYLGSELLRELAVVGLPDPVLAGYAVTKIRQRGFSESVAHVATAPLR